MKNNEHNISALLSFRTVAVLFILICLLTFTGFILKHPLDWQQPETMRLHYYAFQAGVRDGPLTTRLVANDFIKPLSNIARGGGYEARYLVKLLDGIMPRLYQAVFPWTGHVIRPTRVC